MPIPSEPVNVTGGCSCGAVRYRIAVPAVDQRPLNPMTPPSSGIKLPGSITCHCNDCRRAMGSFLSPGYAEVSAPMLTVSAMSPSSETEIVSGRIVDPLAEDYDAAKADAERPPYVPAVDVLRATGESKTWLRFFHSGKASAAMSRSFCGRCGTPLCSHFRLEPEFCFEGKMPEGWCDCFHLSLGTLDREFLEQDWFNPGSEIMFKYGTTMSRCVSATAKGLRELLKVQEFTDQRTSKPWYMPNLTTPRSNANRSIIAVITTSQCLTKSSLRSIGVDITKLEFVVGSSFQWDKEYTMDCRDLETIIRVATVLKAGSEVVRQADDAFVSGLTYPIMQVLDEQYLDVDVQLGGLDQRKIFTFALESMPKLGYKKRAYLMNLIVPGLGQAQKMSSSDPKSKINLLDSPNQVQKKLKKAVCAPREVEGNCIIAFIEHVIFRVQTLKSGGKPKFVVEQREDEPLVYDEIAKLKEDY
ncbi:mss4 [Fusarium austroafricanum]|uniref:tyrosine--tRNA ligase n=1 Tax=Fusarium austroafricanum TaxID=2364996 RepID=A0A8H4NB71_9HYPO|nr:mss4 [Fusarium austroafricanum]